MKKFSKTAGYLFFLSALGVVLLLLLGTLFPIPGNYQLKIVQSGSMEPTIQTGGLIVVRPTDDYKVDDIITFGEESIDSIPTTHRITDVRVQDGNYIYTTKGDANEEDDPQEVREDEIIGKVLFDVPYVGYVIDFARQPLGFTLLVIIPALAVVIGEVMTIVEELKKRKKKNEV